MPFFSIITATFNNGPALASCIESVSSQTFSHYQQIVVDGGSTDGTVEWLGSRSSSTNLIWISEPDDGIADALNKGLRFATGKYVLVLHADDQLLNSGVLSRLYRRLSDEQVDIYSCPIIFEHPVHGKLLKRPIRFIWWHHFKTTFLHQGTLVHRRVFERLGGFSTRFAIAMDYEFFYRAVLKEKFPVTYGRNPVALMAGTGISSQIQNLSRRLDEEWQVQQLSETNFFWRQAQTVWRRLYLPYKLRLKRE